MSLRTLVGDILADLIVGQAVAGKICEGWFLHQAITKVVEVIKDRVEPKATGEAIQVDTRDRLEKFGLLSSKFDDEKVHSFEDDQSRISALFWRIMQYGYLVFVFLRLFARGMSQARHVPRRMHRPRSTPTSSAPKAPNDPISLPPSPAPHVDQTPMHVLNYRLFVFISTLLDLSTRMPWLASTFVFWQHFLIAGPGHFGKTNSTLDK